MNKNKIRVFLVILLVGILFPFATMSKFSSAYATAFNFVFNSLVSHILMHAALFAALSWVVLSFVSQRSSRTILFSCLGGVLLVALLQEGIQMISTHTSDLGAAAFDLGIDLMAAAIPPVFFIWKRYRQSSSN